jgi:hypothetical protein
MQKDDIYSSNNTSIICSDNDGTNDINFHKISDSTESNELYNENNTDKYDLNINIYRYKFSDDFTKELYNFSKIHQYDERKDFKEAWNNWIEENNEIVEMEIRRLNNIGYTGDIINKMFKSARYYFRKKSTEKKEPIKRRNYVSIQRDLLKKMDEHIIKNLTISEKIDNTIYKPSNGFDNFCSESVELLQEVVTSLCNNGLNNPVEIKNKIKKTYKNRYFLLINK